MTEKVRPTTKCDTLYCTREAVAAMRSARATKAKREKGQDWFRSTLYWDLDDNFPQYSQKLCSPHLITLIERLIRLREVS